MFLILPGGLGVRLVAIADEGTAAPLEPLEAEAAAATAAATPLLSLALAYLMSESIWSRLLVSLRPNWVANATRLRCRSRLLAALAALAAAVR